MTITSEYVAGRTIRTAEGEKLFFSGTSYLGIPADPEMQDCVAQAMRRYGISYGTSRTSNFRLAIFEEFEQFIAQKTGYEAALSLSSGYLAGQLLIQHLLNQNPDLCVRYAPHTHPAVYFPPHPVPNDKDFETWKKEVIEEINADSGKKTWLLVTDAVDTLYGQVHDFAWLADIKKAEKVRVLIDDSHTFGVINGGLGISPALPAGLACQIVVMASLAKGSGIPAGCIFGTKKLVAELMENPFFRGSSPASPAHLYAYLQAQNLYERKNQRLMQNIQYFIEKVQALNLFTYTENYPVFYTKKQSLYEFLLQKNMVISHFSYPKSDGEKITRVILNGLHTSNDLDELIKALESFVLNEKNE